MKFALDAIRLVSKPETRETMLATTKLAGQAGELLPAASADIGTVAANIGRFFTARPSGLTAAEKLPPLELGGTKAAELAASKTLELGKVDIQARLQTSVNFGKYAGEHPLATIKTDAPGSDRVRAILGETGNFELVGKMERGTRGAWLVRSPDQNQHIFKIAAPYDAVKRFEQTADAVKKVDSLGVRVPRIEQVGYSEKYGTWYVQELVNGFNAPAPSTRLIAQMIKFNERQAGAALKGQSNWSDDVMNSLYHDSRGWQETIARSGPEGKALVQQVRSMTEKNRNLQLPSGDIVHGDYQHYNALVSGARKERLTAIVDWDYVGRGDRGIDLSRLLYDGYVAEAELGFKANPQTLKMLGQHIESISGRAAFENYMNYWVLQVSEFGVKMGPDKAKMFNGVGRRILDDLKSQPSLISRLTA